MAVLRYAATEYIARIHINDNKNNNNESPTNHLLMHVSTHQWRPVYGMNPQSIDGITNIGK